jgi:hypothetical protein
VQVDPINPTLKLPGTTHLKLKYDEQLSSSGSKLNLRRYTQVDREVRMWKSRGRGEVPRDTMMLVDKVGRCRSTLSNPSRNRLEPSA